MRWLIALTILVTLSIPVAVAVLIYRDQPSFAITCYSKSGQKVFEETLRESRVDRCYADRYGYCINVPVDADCRINRIKD